MIDGLRIRSAGELVEAAVVDASRRALVFNRSSVLCPVERRVVASDQLCPTQPIRQLLIIRGRRSSLPALEEVWSFQGRLRRRLA